MKQISLTRVSRYQLDAARCRDSVTEFDQRSDFDTAHSICTREALQ